ncbi:MAG: efflux RND transporter periplasmic adaptor subunit [Polyangiaceae bacterium]|nr:efflux RND transporter periplasmic adaptor subunit [Polyangiaceae bacterium]
MEAAVKASEAQARAAQAEAQVLKVTLGNYAVKAPIAGTILNKPPEVGEYVGPQPAGITVDMGNVEIADLKSLVVETDVAEQRLGLVKLGGPCEIVLDAYPGRRFRGKALEIIPRVNRSKATVAVKVGFVGPTDGVMPDMAARVSFLTEEQTEAAMKQAPKTIVPASAVVERGGARVVFVLADGVARQAPVKLGPAFGSGFELVSGPSAGARVVKDPAPTLVDGQHVEEEAEL